MCYTIYSYRTNVHFFVIITNDLLLIQSALYGHDKLQSIRNNTVKNSLTSEINTENLLWLKALV